MITLSLEEVVVALALRGELLDGMGQKPALLIMVHPEVAVSMLGEWSDASYATVIDALSAAFQKR